MADAKAIVLKGVYPFFTGRHSSSPDFTNQAIQGATEKWAVLFAAEATDTITHLGFRYGARTGTPPTYRISLQALDSSGRPDGTAIQSATFTPPADGTWDSTFRWVALGASASITRGNLYAIVIDHSSGTIDGSNNSQITTQHRAVATPRYLPGTLYYNGTAWTEYLELGPFGYKSSTKAYGFPVQGWTNVSFNDSSNPDELGMAFKVPSGFCSTYKLRGFRLFGQRMSTDATATTTGRLYSGTTELIASGNIDNDVWSNPTNDFNWAEFIFSGTLPTLNADTEYIISMKTTGTSVSAYLGYHSHSAAADMNGSSWGGAAYYVERNNGGAWTTQTARAIPFELILEEIAFSGGVSGVGIGGRIG